MFPQIKTRLTQHLIEKEISKQKRIKKAVNLQSARKIGILFNLNNEGEQTFINELMGRFTKEGKNVRAICYLPDKNIPEYYLATLKVDVIQPKDLSFFGIPNTSKAKDFARNDFDILIDMSLIDTPSLDYLAVISDAGFKVGRYRKSMINVFDLMIRKREDMDFKDYYTSLLQYLSKIK